MANFQNADAIRASARNMASKINEEVAQRRELFQDLMTGLENNEEEMTGVAELTSLLNLSEDSFALIAPIFLQETEKEYNNPNYRMNLVQSLNAAGYTVEDLREQNDELYAKLTEQTKGLLSQQKLDFLKELFDITYNAMAETEGIASRYIRIPIEYCHPDAKMPAYAHITDSGMDVYALEDITIAPGETRLIPIGIKVAIPVGYELQVRPKSGRCLKTKLRIANAPGTIDSGYRDEIAVIVDNIDPPIKAITGIYKSFGIIDAEHEVSGDIYEPVCVYGSSYTIGKGEKFAQLVLAAVPKVIWTEVEKVGDLGEDRGGGFGSTSIYSKEDKRYGTDLV